ncbi:MAG TPA: VWA domain-containing protein, partial [Planctomycetaceae bacterium]|nr:VWA domain-containing protein [Planctomycetaceae bacterium]
GGYGDGGMGGMGGYYAPAGTPPRLPGFPEAPTNSVDNYRGGELARLSKSDAMTKGRGLSRSLNEALTGDRFGSFAENKFTTSRENPLSTFSIDVDTASYAKCRQLLIEQNRLPPVDAVRIEEFINYFKYEYAGPVGDDPFAAHLAAATCPWNPNHQIVRIALQAEKLATEDRPAANIVFLLDVSGSMSSANKLPLVKDSIRMMVRQLRADDRIAMVVYAGAAGCVLESTPGDRQGEILAALDRLEAGGSTNGGQGIQLAYELAGRHFIAGGVNRVVLCTDGDFNVGATSTGALVSMVEEQAARQKVFLTVLGFGSGNTNDAMMEQISNNGNGVYGFVDNQREAHRQMVSQLAGNLVTVAKDVKIQVEFNPTQVAAYRLLGYDNRVMANEDFNNDAKDAGEIGAGHRVTAMYEIVPVGVASSATRPVVDPLRYQPATDAVEDSAVSSDVEPSAQRPVGAPASEVAGELLAVKLRYKQPEGTESKLLLFPLEDKASEFEQADRDFRWAASMVQFGMLLRNSRFKGQSTWEQLIEQAQSAAGIAPGPDYTEALSMIRTAQRLGR